jgi:hypothetical protein
METHDPLLTPCGRGDRPRAAAERDKQPKLGGATEDRPPGGDRGAAIL